MTMPYLTPSPTNSSQSSCTSDRDIEETASSSSYSSIFYSDDNGDPHHISLTFLPPVVSFAPNSPRNDPPLPLNLPNPIPDSFALDMFKKLFHDLSFPEIISATSVDSRCSIQFNLQDSDSKKYEAHIYPHNPSPASSQRRVHQLLDRIRMLDECESSHTPKGILQFRYPTYAVVVFNETPALTIQHFFQRALDQVPMGLVFHLAGKILNALNELHRENIVHGNISPECIHLRLNDQNVEIVFTHLHHLLEDYIFNSEEFGIVGGLCKQKNMQHKYSSVEVQKGNNPGRKDDFQAWIYVVLFMIKGSLGWEQESDEDSMIEMKLDTSSEGAFSGVPVVFKDLFQEIRSSTRSWHICCDCIRQRLVRAAEEYGSSDEWDWQVFNTV